MLRIAGPLQQQSCLHYPLSQPSQPHFAPTQVATKETQSQDK